MTLDRIVLMTQVVNLPYILMPERTIMLISSDLFHKTGHRISQSDSCTKPKLLVELVQIF